MDNQRDDSQEQPQHSGITASGQDLLTAPQTPELMGVPPQKSRVTVIGDVKIHGHAVLAPMAGVCDMPFRHLSRRYGASAVYTEFVSSDGLIRAHDRTKAMLRYCEAERPVGAQIFGSDPAVIAEAAQLVEAEGFDIVDINFGCPVKKITKRSAGSALLKDPKLLGKIVRAVSDAVTTRPVTAKIRAGWDEINAVEIARICEDNGAQAVAIHGRTQKMRYSGSAMWEVIRDVKAALTIPVIGNGDIFCPKDAFRMIEETGCDLAMIGRAAQGNPWIFLNINRLAEGLPEYQPSLLERLSQGVAHQISLIEEKGEKRAIKEMRTHWSYYTKGIRRSSDMRREMFVLNTHQEVVDALYRWAVTLGEDSIVSR